MTRTEIINELAQQYLEQIDLNETYQNIDCELETDGAHILYGSTIRIDTHPEYRYDTDFCETELVGYDIDNAVITDGSLVIETDGTLPDYIQSITAEDVEKIIIETIQQY